VHLTVSVLTGVFLGTHLLLVFLDRIVPFSLADILIPLHDSYQPIWIAAGILGFYLLLVVWGSSLVRSKIGYSLWRQLHPLALLALGLVMLHALFAGTDGPQLWLRIALVLIVLAVIWLAERWKRVKSFEEMQRRRSRRQQPRRMPAAPQGVYSSQGYAPKTVVQHTYPPEASPPRRSQR
jgi:sulfoxide reductase heme-binding subunit YedZ